MARAVMLGRGGVVVQVKGFGVGDDIGGSEDNLVAIAVEGVVGVSSTGHLAGGGSGIGSDIMYRAIPSIEGIPTQIVHGLAIVADTKFEVAWVFVTVAAVVTVANVVAVCCALSCLQCHF